MVSRVVAGFVAAAALLASAPSQAAPAGDDRPGRLGLGVGGETFVAGLSLKAYLSQQTALQITLGGWRRLGFAVGADGLVDLRPLYRNPEFRVVPYIGAGASLATWDWGAYDNVALFSVAAVGGLALQLRKIPLELALELRPGFVLTDLWPGLHLGAGGALRFYF